MDLKVSNTFTIVALTATPPNDSSQAEVIKYFKLCGEVDHEISVPKLIREKDLSPHQDFGRSLRVALSAVALYEELQQCLNR
jgi:superfamily II DNA or RNA helicase